MRGSRALLSLLCAMCVTCTDTVFVGEQDPNDSGADGDADADGDHDADAPSDAEADVDADEASLGLTCQDVLDCMRACAADLACAVDCSERICPASADAYDELETCGLDSCPAECVNLGTPACADCVATACPLQGFACVSSDC